MRKYYSLGRYEYFVVAIVIGCVATIALNRYSSLIDATRNVRFELIANHFAEAAANLRVQWILDNYGLNKTRSSGPAKASDGVYRLQLSGMDFYFSSQGWPAGTSGPQQDIFNPTLEDCYNLWLGLLQNPPPITKNAPVSKNKEYQVQVHQGKCRYIWLSGTKKSNYFDYDARDGFVHLVVPD